MRGMCGVCGVCCIAGERLVLSHKSLTTATLSCLVSPEDRKAGLGGVRCLVLSHNHFTHLPAFVYDMPQLEVRVCRES